MFGLDAIELARIQFAFTISFHIVFPAITIGLASYLVVLELMWLRTKQAVYRDLYHFWAKIFAVNFAMGVVSGVVMAYQFGTNWSGFSEAAGSITGPLLAYEVLTAFFLEAGFLGVMLFGWNKVGPKLHLFSTVMVALGTLLSTFWILASNSWMHTPQGHEFVDGQFVPVDWWAVIFNPSFPYRLTHTTVGMYLTTAFLVGGAAAWHLLRGNDTPAIRKMLSMSMWMALLLSPVQLVLGDLHGLNTLAYQPAKIAAMEGHWVNIPGEATPLTLVGWPDMEREETRFAVNIPYLGSLLLTHSMTEQVPALTEFAPEDRPNSTIVFWTFRIMVLIGFLMIVTGLWSLWLRTRGRLYSSRRFLRMVLWMGGSGIVAVLMGWYTTEIGRQPWIVYELMRTVDAASGHGMLHMSTTLTLFVIIYIAVFGAGTVYVLQLIRKGPTRGDDPIPEEGGPGRKRTPARPLSTPTDLMTDDQSEEIR